MGHRPQRDGTDMSEPKAITTSELFAELDALRKTGYESRTKIWTPEMDAALIAARTPDADGKVVLWEDLARWFRTRYGINSKESLKKRQRELQESGRL